MHFHGFGVDRTLAQAILGRLPTGSGLLSNVAYHWFSGEALRSLFRSEERDQFSRTLTADLRATLGRRPDDDGARALVDQIKADSEEFVGLWDANDVAIRRREAKIVAHPDGSMHALAIHRIAGVDQTQHLVWLAPPDGPIDQDRPITVDLAVNCP